MAKAIIVVDVQNDFCEGGSLAVQGGIGVAVRIGRWLEDCASGVYDYVVASRDWHVEPGEHFVDWPRHCVANTMGARFNNAFWLNGGEELVDAVFSKGMYSAAYSAFDGRTEPEPGARQLLATWLHARSVTEVVVVGLALDYCVKATALDAVRLGFATTVYENLTAAVDQHFTAIERVERELREAGVVIEQAELVPEPSDD